MYKYFRYPKTTQELRLNCDEDHKQFTRGKRRNLRNAWDDIPTNVGLQKSWKKKRKHQSKVGSRGKKHSIVIDVDWKKEYAFQQYCEQHGISHKVEYKYNSYYKEYEIKKFVPNGKKFTLYRTRTRNGVTVKELIYSRDDGEYVGTGVFKKVKIKQKVKTILIWWSNVNIGIERIIDVT